VRLREIALIRGGLDQVNRQGGEDLPVAAERVLVGGEDAAAVGLDRFGQPGYGRRRSTRADGVRSDARLAVFGSATGSSCLAQEVRKP